MSEWTLVFMGVMAASLVVMASIQIGLIVVGLRVARQMTAATEELRREIRPLVEKAHRIADEAARATSMATLQMERVDQFVAVTTARVDETLVMVQGLVTGPMRQTSAAIQAFRAALAIVRDWKGRRSSRGRDEEDALFVG